MAKDWFESPAVQNIASPSYPVGATRNLRYENNSFGFTVGDALRDYVEWKRIAATRSHFETNLSLINHHIIPRLGDLKASAVNSRIVTEFCRDILETPPKRGNRQQGPRCKIEDLDPEALRKRKKTANTLVGILRLALRMAWENGEIDSDRVWRCFRRLPNADAPRHVFLTRRQCRALIEECRPDLHKLVKAALYSGCRVSELARMKVCDVGAGVFGVYVRPSKNGRARFVVLSQEGMSFFLRLSATRDGEDLLFRMNSGKAWSGNHKHLFKAAVLAARLPDHFVFHGLRHTYASQLVQSGTPLAVVAAQLGHANTDTVSRTYGHLCCESIEAHVERGFASLDEEPRLDVDGLEALRERLSLGEAPLPAPTGWPRSNFALAGFVGPKQ
ncbi:tyrosine-type recombinase/integrase [Ruegeria profundi]|uniref:tyrosine-type recombinase/integrase n=1 Tax=Ruegeria profundi TaxID=1685378 RepID=UPI0012FD95A5|nr:site-specific integrase [Ruegeria profundi]